MGLQAEIDEVSAQCDQAHILNSSMEKKAKQFDRIVAEWKGKADGLGMDLDVAQKEARNASSELFRVKSAYEESVLQLDEVRKENKSSVMRLKTLWIKLVRVEDPFMRSTKSVSGWRLRKWS